MLEAGWRVIAPILDVWWSQNAYLYRIMQPVTGPKESDDLRAR